MTDLDDEVTRLAKRMNVARLGLAQGGPIELLTPLLMPVIESCAWVLARVAPDVGAPADQATFEPVDQPIGPATTSVLTDIVSPVPRLDEACAMGRVGCVLGMRLHNGTECITFDDLRIDRVDDEAHGTRDKPIIADVTEDIDQWPKAMFALDHVHDVNGKCIKNRYMPREECRC